MKKIAFIQNLIAPYRITLFNSLSNNGLDMIVYYMSLIESDRNWKVDLSRLNYPYWIDFHGFYKFIRGFHFHFNPNLICKVLRDNSTDVILAVSWNDLNIILLAILKKLGITKKKYHFWTEANYLTIGARNDNLLKKSIRKFVYSSVDGAFILPGKMAELTLRKWDIPLNKIIFLPNTIQEKDFYLDNDYENIRKANDKPVFILPVRLIEELKGVINFFDAIGISNIKRGLFLIVGDGSDRKKYENYIKENNLSDNIKLLGFKTTKEIRVLYNNANVLLLPSFSDPSPLSLVEALKMKLPILASNHCGNHYETVRNGKNGETFNPLNKENIKNAFEKMMNNRNKWSEYSEESAKLYNEHYSLNIVVESFCDKI